MSTKIKLLLSPILLITAFISCTVAHLTIGLIPENRILILDLNFFEFLSLGLYFLHLIHLCFVNLTLIKPYLATIILAYLGFCTVKYQYEELYLLVIHIVCYLYFFYISFSLAKNFKGSI